MQSPDVCKLITPSVERPGQLLLAVKIEISGFQHGQERLPSVSMTEQKGSFLQLPYSQIVAVVPVIPQRTVHGGIAVIGTFPDDRDGAGQLEIHVGVIYPACGSIHRFAECLAFYGLEDVRQFVHTVLSQSVNQVLELVTYLLPHFTQALQPELHCQREYVNGRRSAHKHRLAYRCDGREHGSGSKQSLAHLLGLSLAGNCGYSYDIAGERRMCEGGTGRTIRQDCGTPHPHFRLGHSADQRSRMQHERRQMHNADARLRNPLVVYLYRRGHALEDAACHSRHSAGHRRNSRRYACHDVCHKVVHLTHVRYRHDGGGRGNGRMHVYPYGQIAELGDRHTRHGRKHSAQTSLNLVQSRLGVCKKVGKTPSDTTIAGSVSYILEHI